jgi:hypothetical protein
MQPKMQTVQVHLTREQAALLEQVVIDAILYAEGDPLEQLWALYRQVAVARWHTKEQVLRIHQMIQPHMSKQEAQPA